MEEFKTFVMNGEKPEHERGFNDDLIFALAISLYIRDTEYNNVMASKDTYKSMLNAIGFSSMNIENGSDSTKIPVDETNKKEGSTGTSKVGGGIFINNGSMGESNDENNDDLNWLLD